ncbi:MAG: hypothetical protein K9N09_12070, partial [Candidatus Cloacimonetes bacterium]|nr:hypothetical protein [Candidatus Cloacimonadota bacterium]MCF7815281.1 hypothetical protein [Candidatus Cloacimonadota bacterium]MCF7869420.1 hypothetical protein [Candidatus Cloacimonadota bacterium]MCF7884814.1 hypothetical protein [Candidatus Cloacimonadota bacterium]
SSSTPVSLCFSEVESELNSPVIYRGEKNSKNKMGFSPNDVQNPGCLISFFTPLPSASILSETFYFDFFRVGFVKLKLKNFPTAISSILKRSCGKEYFILEFSSVWTLGHM